MSRAREKKETKIAHDTQQRTEKKNDTQKVDDEVSARALGRLLDLNLFKTIEEKWLLFKDTRNTHWGERKGDKKQQLSTTREEAKQSEWEKTVKL